jgi:hypothetical protein
LGDGKIQYQLEVVPKRGHTGGRDAVTKEVKLGNGEHAFLHVDGQPFVSKDGEQGMQPTREQRYLF